MTHSLNGRPHLVVTSISAPNAVLRELARGCREYGWRFSLVGDAPSPADFSIDGCDFYSLERQEALGFRSASLLPRRHYARKNIGYLLAIRERAGVIVETDDDNFPCEAFWAPRERCVTAPKIEAPGWVNVYGYFTANPVWPRGFPLDAVRQPLAPLGASAPEMPCPIQQGLADGNPDVDAIYRLLMPLPRNFTSGVRVALGRGAWCPFNSQNTTWFPEAYPLLYLPSCCSFRMTDIWRSFVAQRIGWENGWPLLFHESTVWQERNDHNLMRDFEDELPGYLHNRRIAEALEALRLGEGAGEIGANMLLCYEALVRMGVVGAAEMTILEAWLEDLAGLD